MLLEMENFSGGENGQLSVDKNHSVGLYVAVEFLLGI